MEGRSEHKKGLWTVEEDRLLMDYVKVHGKGKWNRVAKETGLKRSGKSCRLRWMNYLSPSVKRGDFSEEENDLIIRLHKLLGNRWSLIAGRVPGRTDNQVKNHWNTHLSKRLGIKWGKNKVSADSSRFSIKLEDKFNGLTSVTSSSSTPPLTCSEKAIAKTMTEAVSVNTVGFTSTTSYWENSFWFSYNGPNTYDPNLMELLDESLDFIFRGL